MAVYFGTLPFNFGQAITSGAEAVIDGNRNTFWAGTSLTMPLGSVYGTSSSVSFNAFYMSCENVESYTLSGVSAASSTTAPKNVKGTCAMTGDRQYAFHSFASQTASSVTLTTTGSTSRIYEVFIFNSLWSWDAEDEDDVAKINQSQGVDIRGSVVYESVNYELTRTPGVPKFNASYTFQMAHQEWAKKSYDLHHFLSTNPMFTHAVDTDVYPARVYRAIGPDSAALNAITWKLNVGEQVSFNIRER